MLSLDTFAIRKLAELDERGLRRSLAGTAREDGPWLLRDGRRMLSFCCNDYLNLSTHPEVIEAAIAATRRYGAGAGASRLVTGNHPLYAELEARLAALKGTEDACVFGSGYLANIGIIPTLAGKDALVLVDELAHACIWAGARLSDATVRRFRHNDVAHAEEVLVAERQRHRHALIATDGVFSMDGDLAPLSALAALARRHDAWLMSDDAHGIGVLGGGRGSVHVENPPAEVPLQMGTLSKAVGAYGGYLCASRPVVDLIRTRARSFIYSTGLAPGTVAAAIAALNVIAREPDYCALPLTKARAFARATGLPQPASAIVPLILGDVDGTMTASRVLAEAGFLVAAIRPPTVPEGTARLRFTFTARHPDEEVARLAAMVRDRILAPIA
ncbi:MAG TPA: 8-amino-7-oxononanoate synthase [Stellaceae bacterium]|nr:8-amino-7-oxononanoate synthase [Stellaceae bacterium]